ncbi:RHS repeat domain-containing protein [Escherichia coli]|uniref:RHS repeat domain-containing protein n=1 Tax=Escherichia coli TaxID=562 RepID=UPI0022B4FC2E|nr:RHS repeat-associated core domain-containing protein [Escherichia coli]MCZ5469047.1 RHS repeat-associated core domain-containing protein [Escherichia coli]
MQTAARRYGSSGTTGGRFELLAKESRAANDDRSYFYPVVTGPDGAPQEMYCANGRKVWTKHRSLWGLAANDSPDSERESCDAGFMGQWQDEESGLWYNLHRYHDAGTGQYLSQDPLKLSGGLDTQSYVHNPVGWCDPWGLAGEKCPTQMKTIIEEDLAAKKGDALKGKQAEAYDAIKIMLSRGESGKNQHSLHGDLKGKSAADLPGSGKGRGGDRVLYSETENEIIIHDIVDYHKK